ncbi:MAG: TonB-dependent receptor [Chitinophagales bacterium]|nr:TonB-dependent receptor [Chitinophagales bacterium]
MRLLLVICLCIWGLGLYASQSDSCIYKLNGTVRDSASNQPLPFASIYIESLEKGAIADSMGAFALTGICKGTYSFRVSHLDCETKYFSLEIKDNGKYDFRLAHSHHSLGQVVVTEEKKHLVTTQTVTAINAQQLEQTSGTSLGEALKQVAGMSSIQTGTTISKPVIHGLHSNRILILNNGIRQEGQQWGSEHAPEVDPFIADNISIIKGASSVRYGADAIGGVILVEPRHLRSKPGYGLELNFGGFSNGLQGVFSGMVEGNPIKLAPFSWRVQGTMKRAGNLRAPDYYLKNTGYSELDFSTALGWRKERYGMELFYSQFNTRIGILSASHIGNLTDLQQAFESPVPLETSGFSYTIGRPYQQVQHHLLKANAYWRVGNAGRINAVFGLQHNIRQEYDKHKPLNDSLAALNLPELLYKITTYTTDLVWEHTAWGPVKGQIGISGTTQANVFDGRFFIPNFRNFGGGIFMIERFVKLKYELEAGLRYDYKYLQVFKKEKGVVYQFDNRFQNISANVGAIIKPRTTWDIHVNIAKAWRAPAVNELYSNGLHHGAASIEIGDSSLTTEKAYNAAISFNLHPLKDKLHLELAAYYTYIQDFIYAQPTLPPTLTIRGAFPTFQYVRANADFKGLDLTAEYQVWKGLHLKETATLLWAWNYSINDYLILMPSQRFGHQLQYHFDDKGFWSHGFVGMTLTNVLEQKRVPDNSDFAPPPSTYFLLDFEAGTHVKLGKQSLHLSLSIYNLLNKSYREYLDRFRYYADQPGINAAIRIKIPINLT